ncbi:Tripartite tricarboxylate transporter TctB family protein [Oscillibacter sp. PC13]|uniref:tripartite tricarboxylate transporter TctB family protein n=1 Tax=Oscillibacter sp. PC13 TaxID=1855299 RepID=UPI0008E7F874|nr:tripartite tricarboxylate transporter TctB family protein [Oscillibacter sp. PC13]SFP34499.1 Tripartite tricarboxylate transporter TctB family protein [Oscillibacter sp. PC13]
MNKKRIIHQDVYISVLLMILGVYLFYLTTKMMPEAARFPRMALGVFMILMVWTFVDGVRKSIAATNVQEKKDIRLLKWEQNKMPFALFVITVAYAIGLDFLGFFTATAIFIPVVMLFFRCRNIKLIAGVTIGTLLFVYLMFVVFLHAALP